MENAEDAAYRYWELLKVISILQRLEKRELIDREGYIEIVEYFKEEWELSEPAEMLSDTNYTNGLENQYGHDAASCPIQSIQAKWKARQAASIDPKYVSFNEIVKRRRSQLTPSYALQCWLRNGSTVDFLFLWEKYQNPKFKQEEALALIQELEESNGTLTLKQWIERTGAVGITTLPGRYGGTYAARTLADDFEMWISPRYRYYAFQRDHNSLAKWLEDFEHAKDMEELTGANDTIKACTKYSN